MEPNIQPTPEQNIAPKTSVERANLGVSSVESATSDAPEKLVEGMELPTQSTPTSDSNLPVPVDPAMKPAVITKSNDSATTSSVPAIADDVDLIEKEWVDKARSIVNEYKHDPYMQEKAVGKLQSEYIKKRYGKTVKTDD